MITLRRSYPEFKMIVQEKKLQPFIGNNNVTSFHVLAVDNEIIYEAYILKDDSQEYRDFLENDLNNLENKKNLEPIWNTIETSFPSSQRDVFTYKFNGSEVMIVNIDYTNSSKNTILKIEKVII